MADVSTELDHAWKWFEYHASQRLIVIRLYLVMAGALGAGYLASLNSNHELISLVVAVFGACISVLFWLLDCRVTDLIKSGEAALFEIEKRLAETSGIDALKFIEKADAKSSVKVDTKRKALMNFLRKKLPLQSYGEVFFTIFLLAFAAFVIAALISLTKLFPL